MSKRTAILCDGIACESVKIGDKGEMRQQMRQRKDGWVFVGKRDFCPDCLGIAALVAESSGLKTGETHARTTKSSGKKAARKENENGK